MTASTVYWHLRAVDEQEVRAGHDSLSDHSCLLLARYSSYAPLLVLEVNPQTPAHC